MLVCSAPCQQGFDAAGSGHAGRYVGGCRRGAQAEVFQKTCRRVTCWFLSFRLTKPVSHPPSRGGSPPSAAGLRWIVKKKFWGWEREIYIYIYIYMYVSLSLSLTLSLYIYIHMYTCKCGCRRIEPDGTDSRFERIDMYVYNMCIYIYIYICYMYKHVCMCMYIYIYIGDIEHLLGGPKTYHEQTQV